MSTELEKEINAIKTVLEALEPLSAISRTSVIEYVFKRLGMPPSITSSPQPAQLDTLPREVEPSISASTQQSVHMSDLKDEKQPKSAIEMAVLVAYYLSHLAPEDERKQAVITKDLETYFKIAQFKLPTRLDFTLPNAKKAGYLDMIGGGEYKLNPVGYNLVVHSMPKSGEVATSSARRKPSKKKTGKKAVKKKVRK